MPEPESTQEADAPGGRLMRIDEAVVHDLSHELGNYFHKLYYWTDCIRSGASDLGPDASPTQALDETMHHLQSFLNLALEYFQPGRLVPVSMPVPDVARALEGLLRGENPDSAIVVRCADDVAHARVHIDPQRLSSGMRIVARLLGGGSGTALSAVLDARSSAPDVLEIVVSATGGAPDAAARRAQRVVEWAVAGRMLELHGGQLATNEERAGSASCVLTLPLAN
jgi:hypothetical protein